MSNRRNAPTVLVSSEVGKKKLGDLANLLTNNSNASTSELGEVLKRLDDPSFIERFSFTNTLNCTVLYYICSLGKVDFVKELLKIKPLLKLDGVQEEKGGSPLLAAQLAGSVQIVSLLLIFGAIPDYISLRSNVAAQSTEQNNSGIQAQFLDIYNLYEKYGATYISTDFPSEAEFYAKIKVPTERNPVDGMSLISKNIEGKKTFIYKKRTPVPAIGLVNSLYASIEHVMQIQNLRNSIEDWMDERKEEILSGFNLTGSGGNVVSPAKGLVHKNSMSLKKIPVLSPIFAITQKYNVNVIVVIWSVQSNKLIKRYYYVNPHKKHSFPTIYLAYDGTHYEPIVDIPDDTVYNSPQEVFKAIINPETTIDHFSFLLENFDVSKINSFHVLGERQRTLFYAACRSGRADFVLRMISIPSLNVHGPQDQESGSTPLHVASWYGFVDVIIILLFKEADPNAENNNKEKASLFNEKLPQETINRLKEIWTIYEKKDRDLLAHEVDAISDRIQIKATLQASSNPTASSSPPPKHAQTDKGPIVLEKLCELLKGDTPPPFDVFLDYFSRFDKRFVNDFSVLEKVTPFYLACRSGSIQIVMEFMEVEGIRLTGEQERRTTDGNTPLHIANWRGHVPVVAYLLTRVEPEPKANGNFPGVDPEIYQGKKGKEDDIKRVQLARIFDIAKQPGKVDRLRPYWEDIKLPKPMPQIPLSITLSLPSEEVPPQYLKLTYLWYEKKSKLILLDLHTSSCLDTEYSKWCEVPDKPEVEVKIYTPPVRGTFVWSIATWKVNFQQFVATSPEGNKILLVPIKRAQVWYMKSKEGPLIPFSNKINTSIGDAIRNKKNKVSFVYSEGLFIFKKKVMCTIDFQTRQANLSDTPNEYYPVIHEGEFSSICNWRPDDIKFTERRTVTMEEGVIVLHEETEEWKQVSSAFYSTIPQLVSKRGKLIEANRIIEIKKLFHPSNRDIFNKTFATTLGFHKNNPIGDYIEYKKMLWHGTGSLDPLVIWSTPGNWKPNYSSDKNLWGRGCYFASDAAYSANYAFKAPNGNKILLLAEVIVGQGIQCMENSNIVDNPPTPTINCIVGWRHGAWIYVVYQAAQAFPVYSVEWKEL